MLLYDAEAAKNVLSGLSLEGSTAGEYIQNRGEFLFKIEVSFCDCIRGISITVTWLYDAHSFI